MPPCQLPRFLPMLNLLALVLVAVLVACDPGSPQIPTDVEQPTAIAESVPTSTPAAAPTATSTPTPAPTSTLAATPTATPAPTPAPTPTPTLAPTSTPEPTPTPMPTSTPTPAQLALSDRQTLEALFDATGGPDWKNSAGWLTHAPIGQWHGVTATSEGRVATLDLADNGLEGEIPPRLGDLTELRRLSLTRNRLSGEIPPELGNLRNLTLLWLSGNALSGEIPPELENLRNLDALYLANNRLSGEIPPWLGNLSKLEYLALTSNQLSGQIPPELGDLHRLKSLGLGLNSLSGEVPSELANLRALTSLWLSDNALSGEIPPWLGNLANLERLRLGGSGLTGCIPDELQDQLDPADDPGMPFCSPMASIEQTVAQLNTPSYIKWDVGDGVSEEDSREARHAAALMHDYAASIGLPEIKSDISIYLHNDLDVLAEIYSGLSGLSVREAREMWENNGGTAGDGWAIINRSEHRMQSGLGRDLRLTIAHELFHVYQIELMGLPARDGGPVWLMEGIADFSIYKALDAVGVVDYDMERSSGRGLVSAAKRVDKPLEELKTYADWRQAAGNAYAYSLLAAELLVSYKGEEALLRYYQLLQPGTTWEEAFEEAFGMPVEEFYTFFEEHRAAGFPKVNTYVAGSGRS